MDSKDIVKIIKIEKVFIKNTHHGFSYPRQDVLEITNRAGEVRIIDLLAERDITDIDYFKLIDDKKTTRRVVFQEYCDTI